MSMSVIIKLILQINLIPASFCKENGKLHFSWFSFKTQLNLFLFYCLGLSMFIYYNTQMNYAFVKATTMEFARYIFRNNILKKKIHILPKWHDLFRHILCYISCCSCTDWSTFVQPHFSFNRKVLFTDKIVRNNNCSLCP